ncbi:nucleoside-diphosphate-sugar epimerase [Rahnella aquatilis CIP 78.65 = ATCC 33071]|uniref:Nucleoside-diphosphate-sugar epimerase n=1 Tax=Rahnella aquatilis (strain ATCC 33071 / DSM 4594 / JCM 1683 / NBRC 105701 / NCIMB 13365 / CIP 78.65) TaxID=745277 RepID=H2ISC1_RAHAC|nr:SDR family oxidoreductase [Rahnella aquatilis]AEX51501.1 nucleoside-diphosphate-sugar epimerase [Rahnella aquatilis CIP 78.65 = ATCC 33071]KFD16961.1 nucleoside-diphosphate-sugar epimerase [Rahnella aquatilis CIP 78.65 = ATCC 33071]
MRVFVTGATGFVGSAVVQELLRAGHQVLGLARSDASAQALTDAGADVLRGSIEDLDSLRSGAAQADGVIHMAFIHDFSKFHENCEKDRLAIGALGAALKGTHKPLIVTSGTALVNTGRLATENDLPDPQGQNPRVASELAVANLAEQGVRVSLVRLPPSVHGEGDHGFVPMIIAMAREKGESAYPGDGENCWPAVHRFDAARVFVLALEKGAQNAIYHASAEEGVPFREIATMIGKHLNLPVISKNAQEAAAHFSWFAHFASLNNPTSSQITRHVLGWKPTHQDLLTDIDTAGYFQ